MRPAPANSEPDLKFRQLPFWVGGCDTYHTHAAADAWPCTTTDATLDSSSTRCCSSDLMNARLVSHRLTTHFPSHNKLLLCWNQNDDAAAGSGIRPRRHAPLRGRRVGLRAAGKGVLDASMREWSEADRERGWGRPLGWLGAAESPTPYGWMDRSTGPLRTLCLIRPTTPPMTKTGGSAQGGRPDPR